MVEDQGARVFLESSLAAMLDDKVLDESLSRTDPQAEPFGQHAGCCRRGLGDDGGMDAKRGARDSRGDGSAVVGARPPMTH